jgi:drug/metabolite transporter (DMT)-like permease
MGLLGIGLVGGGIAWLGLSARRSPGTTRGVLWALATAGTIAAYSMIDKAGVARAHPVAYVIVLLGLSGCILTPYVLWKRDARDVRALWRRVWPSAVVGGVLSLLAYLLVLTAMRLAQVSYVAALRETSVVFAAALGARMLDEPYGGRRVAASAVVAGGLVLLVIAMRG